MPFVKINGVNFFYELKGTGGSPFVFVHGSWGDHHSWDAVSDILSKENTVLSYDRRGHSQSQRPQTQGSLAEDADDLAAIVRHFDLVPANIAGNSFGASTVLTAACGHPEIFRSLIVNEPPLVSLLEDDPQGKEILPGLYKRFNAVLDVLKKGENEAGAELFFETIAGKPGDWEQLRTELQKTYTFNAPTWMEEMQDPNWNKVDSDKLKKFSKPALVTTGEISPPFFKIIVNRLLQVLPNAEHHVYTGAGHGPHSSHPSDYVNRVKKFISDNSF